MTAQPVRGCEFLLDVAVGRPLEECEVPGAGFLLVRNPLLEDGGWQPFTFCAAHEEQLRAGLTKLGFAIREGDRWLSSC